MVTALKTAHSKWRLPACVFLHKRQQQKQQAYKCIDCTYAWVTIFGMKWRWMLKKTAPASSSTSSRLLWWIHFVWLICTTTSVKKINLNEICLDNTRTINRLATRRTKKARSTKPLDRNSTASCEKYRWAETELHSTI